MHGKKTPKTLKVDLQQRDFIFETHMHWLVGMPLKDFRQAYL